MIRFTQDFTHVRRGAVVGTYKTGDVTDTLKPDTVKYLVGAGIAERVERETPAVEAKPKPAKGKGRGKKDAIKSTKASAAIDAVTPQAPEAAGDPAKTTEDAGDEPAARFARAQDSFRDGFLGGDDD